MADSFYLSHKKIIRIIILLFVLGAFIGFLFEPTFVNILLQPEINNISTTSANVSQILIIKFMFPFFVALAFVSIPVSGIIAGNISNPNHFNFWMLFFMIVTVVMAISQVLYYRQYFSEMSSAIDISEFSPAFDVAGISSANNIYIALDKLPYYKIPIISGGTNLILALIIMGLRKTKIKC